MATAKAAPAEPPKLPRRCAKCATPAPEKSFQSAEGPTPYCEPCRGRFPSLRAARCVLSRPRLARKR